MALRGGRRCRWLWFLYLDDPARLWAAGPVRLKEARPLVQPVNSQSRRAFLSGGQRSRSAATPLRPPWTDNGRVLDACTACGDCITSCPQDILSPDSAGHPILSFAARECTLCGACAAVCAQPVFLAPASPPFDHVAAPGADCFARRGVHCQTCGDACPAGAIRFVHRLGGPPLPEVVEDRCTGCGACISVCPAAAISVRQGHRLAEASHG